MSEKKDDLETRQEVTSNFRSEALLYSLLPISFLLYFSCRSQLRGWAGELDVERKQEEGTMFELGSVLNTGYSVPAANPTLNGISNAAEAGGNADDADAAVIADPLAVEIAGDAYPAAEISGNGQPQLEQTRAPPKNRDIPYIPTSANW